MGAIDVYIYKTEILTITSHVHLKLRTLEVISIYLHISSRNIATINFSNSLMVWIIWTID